ncbi:MAG TPA: ATP-binding protein [Myxococcota bacterium]|nr:ATP-binding protein [Myxococcota bacterium]
MSIVARRALLWIAWGVILTVVTVALVSVRERLDQAHVALVYLLVVLGGSASAGRSLGIVLALACFVLIDYYLQTPYGTLSVDKGLDWLLLLAFLTTAIVAAQLLGRANAEAAAARERADEIDRLSSLGAETLSAGRAEDALAAVAKVIQETIGAARCEILTRSGLGDDSGDVRSAVGGQTPEAATLDKATVDGVIAQGRAAAIHTDGTLVQLESGALVQLADRPPGPLTLRARLPRLRTLLLPLVAHDRTVGVLRLDDPAGLSLDPPKLRFLSALAYYAALAVDRLRLVAEAEHADALRQADQLKDSLLASVSHDLRTPLTTIKVLAHDIAGGGEERAAVIEEQVDRLNHMVADLLDLSRLNAGGVPIHPEINAAEDLVGAAIQQVGGAIGGREIRTVVAWSEPVVAGRFDFVHSLRIVVNLIENALKYTPPSSPIDVEVTQEGGMLVIAVGDRGPGVPKAERERIFEAFYRPSTGPPDAGGAGLGLAIARRLAEAQGGSLRYQDRLGGGSVFSLRLPAVSLPDEAQRAFEKA